MRKAGKVLGQPFRNFDYHDLFIRDGSAASRAFLRMIAGEVSRDEQKQIRSDLEAYCSRDTYGMILILTALKRLAEL